MNATAWLPPALTALFSLAVLTLAWSARQMVKLTTTVGVLTVEVKDLRKNGSDRLEEILSQTQRNERITFIVAGLAVIGWTMRGWIMPRGPYRNGDHKPP